MTRKGKDKWRKERDDLFRVHYECVRRNPEYRKRYAEAGEHGWGAEYARRVLAAEWGIRSGDPPNPEDRPPLASALMREVPAGWSVATRSLTDRRLREAAGVVSAALTKAKIDRASVSGTLTLAYIPDEDRQRHRVTTVDMRWSKKDLMDLLEGWIDVFLKDRGTAGLKQERLEKRLRVGVYTHYLRVYDLREAGKKYREIAHALWPRQSGDLEKRARDYYNKGKALVLDPPLMPEASGTAPHRSAVQKPSEE
jgi:hypothetical protein